MTNVNTIGIQTTGKSFRSSALAKLAGVALLTGAVALAVPQRANAQVRFGVSVGIPVHAGPVYASPVYGPGPVVYGPVRHFGPPPPPPPVYGYYGGYYGPHYGWYRAHPSWHGYYR